MFKNCCGCKNSQAVIGEAYEPKQNVVTVEKNQEPVVVVTPPDDMPVAKSPQEVKKPPAVPQVEVEEVKDEQEEEEEEEKQQEEEELMVVVPPDLTGPSRQGSVEMDSVDLQAVARGMIATPHPSKRGSGVPNLAALPQWLSQEDDDIPGEGGGTAEPPATPVGRDELALRRHRFFSDLLQAHQAGTEHRVRFDPLGPTVAGGGADTESEPRTPAIEFENLLNRLERVTARLEHTVEVATGTVLLSQTASRLTQEQEAKAPPLPPPLPPPPSPPPPLLPDTMSVEGFSNIIRGPLANFLQLSQKIGGDVATQADMVRKAFDAQLEFLEIASKSASPASQAETMKLLVPTSTHIVGIQEFREKNRGSNHFNHLSAVSESVAALGWVTVSPAPAPYVKEMNDAGQFYTNRVLKDWKEKDKTHVDWVKSWIQILTELQQFVKQYHTTGLVWGGRGIAAPPPPPPGVPPPPPVLPIGDVAPAIDNAAQDRSALFAEINRGEGITSTLKRVTPDMQTHKNPALRSGPAPFKAPATSATHKPVSAPKVDKPPTLYKDGKKWMVEHQQGNHSLVIDQVEMNNVVYMYNCRDSTLTVKGKINSVVLDSCRKSSVVFDTLVSSIEFVNCQSVQMQVLGKVPTISIDKTDGCQMYLNSESMEVEIISSKSSEMNVLVPKGNGDYVEYPIPEQFKTTVRPGGLSTIAIENKG